MASHRYLRGSSRPLLTALASFAALSVSACTKEAPKESREAPPASAPTPAPPAAQVETGPTAAELLKQTKISVFVLHTTAKPEVFIEQFAKNDAARERAGVLGHLLSRGISEPSRFIVHYAAKNQETVETFLESDDYLKLLDADAADSSSLLWYGENNLLLLPDEVPGKSVSLYKKFPVADFDIMKSKLEAAGPELKSQGMRLLGLHRSTQNPKVAILHLVTESEAQANAIYRGPLLSGAREAAGATDWESPFLATDHR